ncbi:conserved hypothetical protein [delta proteobacterium NaphS2]|nr:conserved hypothetical protein [delta proteobacterium NaphS2]
MTVFWDKRDTRTTVPGHHVPIRRKKDARVPSKEEQLLVGNDAVLDAYVAELKKRSHGRGVSSYAVCCICTDLSR